MSVAEFINRYIEAFGVSVPFPIALWYGDEPVTEIKKIPRCFIGAISKVRDGNPLTLCAENVTCGGGSTYTVSYTHLDVYKRQVSSIKATFKG